MNDSFEQLTVNASPGQVGAHMTVVTSPQGRQRIVVYKTTKCGEWSFFSCVVTYVETNFVSTENRDQLLTNQNSELQ